MNKLNRLVKDGTPKGEIVILAAESDVGKTTFPPRRYNTSSKLTDVQLSTAGGCVIALLHIVIFLARVAEWFWSTLPDKCEVDGCRRMGIRGNENREDGILMCDYCSYLRTWGSERADSE